MKATVQMQHYNVHAVYVLSKALVLCSFRIFQGQKTSATEKEFPEGIEVQVVGKGT